MKGQYRLINEFMIFAMGIFIVFSVAANMDSSENWVKEVSTKEQMMNIYTIVHEKIIEANQKNAKIYLDLPKTISGESYSIALSSSKITVSTDEYSLSKDMHDVSSYNNVKGTVYSGGRFIIFSDSTNLEIRRE